MDQKGFDVTYCDSWILLNSNSSSRRGDIPLFLLNNGEEFGLDVGYVDGYRPIFTKMHESSFVFLDSKGIQRHWTICILIKDEYGKISKLGKQVFIPSFKFISPHTSHVDKNI